MKIRSSQYRCRSRHKIWLVTVASSPTPPQMTALGWHSQASRQSDAHKLPPRHVRCSRTLTMNHNHSTDLRLPDLSYSRYRQLLKTSLFCSGITAQLNRFTQRCDSNTTTPHSLLLSNLINLLN